MCGLFGIRFFAAAHREECPDEKYADHSAQRKVDSPWILEKIGDLLEPESDRNTGREIRKRMANQ